MRYDFESCSERNSIGLEEKLRATVDHIRSSILGYPLPLSFPVDIKDFVTDSGKRSFVLIRVMYGYEYVLLFAYLRVNICKSNISSQGSKKCRKRTQEEKRSLEVCIYATFYRQRVRRWIRGLADPDPCTLSGEHSHYAAVVRGDETAPIASRQPHETTLYTRFSTF